MPMRKAFLYSLLFHAAVAVVAIVGIPSGKPLPVEQIDIMDVEIADLTQTTERRAPDREKKAEPKPEPEPEETKVAALPPQPQPIPEAAEPEPIPIQAEDSQTPPLPAVPRPKPVPPKEDEFDMMLKDLQNTLDTDPKKEPDKEPPPEPEKDFFEGLADALDTPDPETEPLQPQAQMAPVLGNRLTISEEDALSRHIEPCWNVQIGARNPEELAVDIRLYINRDGTVRRAEVVDNGKMARDKFYRAAAEAAMRAVLNKRCQPLPIPPDKYEQLKSFVYHFDPSKMIGR